MKKIFKDNKKIIIISILLIILFIIGTISFLKQKNNSNNASMCVIQFDTKGGTKIKAQKINCGTTLKKLEIPKKEGFKFVGWTYMDEEFNYDEIINDNIMLVANYIALDESKIVKVSFDTDGGSKIDFYEVMAGSTISKPDNPQKKDYKFEGWYYNYKKFDFKTSIDKDIVLKAKWIKNKNSSENVNINKSKSDYKCQGSFRSDVPEINVNVGYTNPVDWIWQVYGSYNEQCKINYKTSNKNIVSVDDSGIVNAKKTGEAYIYECINDIETGKEVLCFKGKIVVENKKCNYWPKKDMQSTKFWMLKNGEKINWTSAEGYFDYEVDSCEMIYKSENSKIASVSSSGVITADGVGKTIITGCIKEISTNSILECKEIEIQVNENDENNHKNGYKLLNAIAGYYWYLDGYKYAYLYPTIIDWYDHQLLNWDSGSIDISNDKFVMSEDSNKRYQNADNIHNRFLVNPLEFAYMLIDEYKMKVENDKLYITLGGKKYTFTKRNTKVQENILLSLSSNNLTINEGSDANLALNVSNYFFEHLIDVTSSNGFVANCYPDKSATSNGKINLKCEGYKAGSAKITIKDSISNEKTVLNIIVNHVNVSVKGVTLNKSSLNLLREKTFGLKAEVLPNNADNKKLKWDSSDEKVAKVNQEGLVTATGKGTAIITVTTEDGNYTANCVVNVTNPPLTATADVGISIIIDSNVKKGILVSLNVSGGTGIYNYYIKLYSGNTLIGQTTNTNESKLFVPGYMEGIYYAEFEVKDSDGNSYKGTTGLTTIS